MKIDRDTRRNTINRLKIIKSNLFELKLIIETDFDEIMLKQWEEIKNRIIVDLNEIQEKLEHQNNKTLLRRDN